VDRNHQRADRTTDIAVDDIAGLASDRHVPAQQVLGGYLSECDDQFGVDLRNLAFEIPQAVVQFPSPGVTVLGRATPHTVGDANVRASEARVPQCFIEDVAASADERFALLVLLCAGCLADEQEIGVWRADSVDDPAPRIDQVRAPLAASHCEPVHVLGLAVVHTHVSRASTKEATPRRGRGTRRPRGLQSGRHEPVPADRPRE
jgi:hypothetical protein